jgi:hypothetical protein
VPSAARASAKLSCASASAGCSAAVSSAPTTSRWPHGDKGNGDKGNGDKGNGDKGNVMGKLVAKDQPDAERLHRSVEAMHSIKGNNNILTTHFTKTVTM